MAKAPTINTDILAPISTEAHQETIAESQIAAIGQDYSQGRDLVNQLLGQAQAFQAAGDLLRTFGVSKLAIVKENKLYRDLAGTKTPNGSELKGTWVEFCNLLGISDDKANQDIANLQAFGEDALEQMQRIGIGYRDLRQFRKLPQDQRTALIEAAKTGDKDTMLELAEDLISKHIKEKTELESQVQELEADSEAKDKIIESKNTKLDDLEKTLHKMRNRTSDWSPRAFEISAETTTAAAQALECMDKLDTLRDVILNEDFGEGDHEAAVEAMASVYFDAVDQVLLKVSEVMAACEHVFAGYKDRARPLLEAFNTEQQAAVEVEAE